MSLNFMRAQSHLILRRRSIQNISRFGNAIFKTLFPRIRILSRKKHFTLSRLAGKRLIKNIGLSAPRLLSWVGAKFDQIDIISDCSSVERFRTHGALTHARYTICVSQVSISKLSSRACLRQTHWTRKRRDRQGAQYSSISNKKFSHATSLRLIFCIK